MDGPIQSAGECEVAGRERILHLDINERLICEKHEGEEVSIFSTPTKLPVVNNFVSPPSSIDGMSEDACHTFQEQGFLITCPDDMVVTPGEPATCTDDGLSCSHHITQ